MNWNEKLPNPDDWKPRNKKSESLSIAFYKKCSHIEQLIKIRTKIESELNIDNFDSGPGIEDIIREEFQKLIPKRYKIIKGVINDCKGKTAGDCDLIIMNDFWFPAIKDGASNISRRIHFPIESIYSVVEVKKTLSYQSLDDALKKLVVCKRLEREKVYEWKITENSHRENKTFEACRNNLFTGIIATGLPKDISINDIFKRFKMISKQIPPEDRVDSICILGHGVLTWGYQATKKRFKSTKFDGIYTSNIYLDEIKNMEIYEYQVDEEGNTLIYFISNMLTNLFYSVLEPHNLWYNYSLPVQVKKL